MWEIIAALIIWGSPPDRPFLSCIDGHIVERLSECPPIPDHKNPSTAPIGGGPGRRGLLGLGGLGGIL
jgi:hypothetical protein